MQTNGTILTSRVKDILSRGNFQIGVSLDSLNKETYESIRINANFDKVMDNILYFNDYCSRKNIKFSISTCVMRQNWRELPDFINFCNRLDATATFHKVWFPAEYALYNLKATELVEIHNLLSTYDFPQNTAKQKLNSNHYRYFISVIGEWMKAADQLDGDVEQVNTLSGNELLSFIKDKIKKRIDEKDISEQEKDVLLNTCIHKIETVLNLFDVNKRDGFLKLLASVPSQFDIVNTIEKSTVEYLFEEAGKQVKLVD